VVAELDGSWDWRVCYQSRVGPMKWIAPSTDEEIRRAGAEGRGVIVAPIAFVSEHVETLVELDRDYADLARKVGCTPYLRVPALGVEAGFVETLRDAVIGALDRGQGAAPHGAWTCPRGLGRCARAMETAA
jgi:ferrochelatase